MGVAGKSPWQQPRIGEDFWSGMSPPLLHLSPRHASEQLCGLQAQTSCLRLQHLPSTVTKTAATFLHPKNLSGFELFWAPFI